MKNNSALKSCSLILIGMFAFVFSTYAQQSEVIVEEKTATNAVEQKTDAKSIFIARLVAGSSDTKISEVGNKTVVSSGGATFEITTDKKSGKTFINNGLFTYEYTGNDQMDNDLYGAAKTEFVNKHPDLYEKWVRGEISSSPKTTEIKE